MAGSVVFASLRQEQEWHSSQLWAYLKEIIDEIAEYALVTWGWLLCVTSIYRTDQENRDAGAKTSIHCYWRAVDIRTRNVDPEWVTDVTKWANGRWIYDPNRPHLPLVYSAVHGTGPHMHVQICTNTRLRSTMPAPVATETA